ncbi:hypothetical protein ACWF9G_08835 [Nocardia sp. NPDC055029]
MTFKTLTAALPIAVALITNPASGTATAAPAPSCTFTFYTNTVYTQHGAVVGGGYVDCAITPAAFSINLTLRYKPRGGDWTTRSSEPSIEIPAPRRNIATSTDCENGLWKGVATIWETAANGATIQTDFPSAPAIITC